MTRLELINDSIKLKFHQRKTEILNFLFLQCYSGIMTSTYALNVQGNTKNFTDITTSKRHCTIIIIKPVTHTVYGWIMINMSNIYILPKVKDYTSEFHRQMARRFGRYAVLLLHTIRAHISWTLLSRPTNASLRLCRSAMSSVIMILVFSYWIEFYVVKISCDTPSLMLSTRQCVPTHSLRRADAESNRVLSS
jgi:hypothetical protein